MIGQTPEGRWFWEGEYRGLPVRKLVQSMEEAAALEAQGGACC